MLIALCGQKGGSGKTTVAISVVAELLARGNRVLLVDADPQGTSRTWVDVAAEAKHPTPTVVSMGAKMHLPGQLDAIAVNYDFTVIDCPPRHGDVQRSALMIADLAVLPCGPSAVDVWAMTEPVEIICEARKIRPDLRVAALITRRVARAAIGAAARQALEVLGLAVLRSELGFRIAYQESPAAGLGVAQYAPRSAAALEIRSLVDELLEELAHGKEAKHRPAQAPKRPGTRSQIALRDGTRLRNKRTSKRQNV